MATIYRRQGKKTWWIAYYANGKRVQQSLGTTDRRVALYMKNKTEKALAERQRPPQLRTFPIRQVVDEYLSYCEARQTRRSFVTTKGRLLGFLDSLNVTHLQDITGAHVQSYLTKRVQRSGITNKTANHILTAIKAFLNYCVKHDYLGRNPAIVVDRFKVPNIPGRHLALEEIERLLEAAKQHYYGWFYPMLATAIYAGLRLGELFGLEWSDVDFQRKEIMVKDKPRLGLRTKDADFRVVPMHERLAALLQPFKKSSGFCFFPHKAVRKTTSDFNRHFKELIQKANLPPDVNWLTMRRTFGSQLAQHKVDLLRIQMWMGHSDPRLTITHYAHLKQEYDEAINSFPSIQSSPPNP